MLEETTYTKEGFVTIPIDKYDDLIATVTNFKTFIYLALRTAQLNFIKTDLRIDEDIVKASLLSVDEEEYKKRAAELVEEVQSNDL